MTGGPCVSALRTWRQRAFLPFGQPLGRTASVLTGNGATPVSEVDTAYAPCACSPLGKMHQQTQPYLQPNAAPATIYTYDALGRTINVLLPDGFSHHPSGNDIEKYATYTRDGLTGLDYAVNRYYSSQWGRFCRRIRVGGALIGEIP